MRPAPPWQRAMQSMGYLLPGQRASCQNCRHSVRVEPTGAINDRWPLRCSVGGFGVGLGATCDRHERKST